MTCPCCLSRRALLRAALGTAAAAPLAGCGVADPGHLVPFLVAEETEARLGREAFAQILARTPVVRDPFVQDRVRAVGARLVAASSSPWSQWRFVVFARPEPNAFALPGGQVGVFEGMLRVAEDDAQLAAVLGHEIGHVNARHGAERLVAEHLVRLAVNVVAGLVALGDAPVPPELVTALGATVGEYGVVRPFSRSQELEADALGVGYMVAAGYDPDAAVAFWRRMAAQAGDGGPPAFLSTHPANQERIERLQALTGA
jgi:predicted Zn-dependent protease